jgi:hypothetical protein
VTSCRLSARAAVLTHLANSRWPTSLCPTYRSPTPSAGWKHAASAAVTSPGTTAPMAAGKVGTSSGARDCRDHRTHWVRCRTKMGGIRRGPSRGRTQYPVPLLSLLWRRPKRAVRRLGGTLLVRTHTGEPSPFPSLGRLRRVHVPSLQYVAPSVPIGCGARNRRSVQPSGGRDSMVDPFAGHPTRR